MHAIWQLEQALLLPPSPRLAGIRLPAGQVAGVRTKVDLIQPSSVGGPNAKPLCLTHLRAPCGVWLEAPPVLGPLDQLRQTTSGAQQLLNSARSTGQQQQQQQHWQQFKVTRQQFKVTRQQFKVTRTRPRLPPSPSATPPPAARHRALGTHTLRSTCSPASTVHQWAGREPLKHP
jgi:hypothetical protein